MLFHQLLLDGALRRPERTAFHWIDRERSLSYAGAVEAMECAAGLLHHLGVRKGDRVTICAHNGLDYLVAMFGCFRLGAIAALVNVKFADELDHYLGNHQPAAIIYTHDLHAEVMHASTSVDTLKHHICMDGAQAGALSWPEMMAARFAPPPDPADDGAPAHLSYTSGTSGKPKGACLAHEPVVRATRCIAERLRINPDDISFGPTALSSSYQLVGNLLPPLHHGCTINVMGRWTQSSGYDALAASAATLLVANPTLLNELLVESRARGKAPMQLRALMSGGGPVPPALKCAWRDEWARPLVESYGQSELGGFVALGAPTLADDKHLGAIGRALPDKEVRIFDTDDQEVPPGEVGEIVLRGGCMWGYWGMPDKTAQALRNQWLHTGDLGSLDPDGYLTLRGRRSELINVGGDTWFPRDIEEALMQHASVSQAALIGLPDHELGERPVAFVVPANGETVDAALLCEFAARQCGRDLSALTITGVVSLPMTPTGKIAKVQLAHLVKDWVIPTAADD